MWPVILPLDFDLSPLVLAGRLSPDPCQVSECTHPLSPAEESRRKPQGPQFAWMSNGLVVSGLPLDPAGSSQEIDPPSLRLPLTLVDACSGHQRTSPAPQPHCFKDIVSASRSFRTTLWFSEAENDTEDALKLFKPNRKLFPCISLGLLTGALPELPQKVTLRPVCSLFARTCMELQGFRATRYPHCM